MPRITIKQDDQKQRKGISDAQKIFIMHCKLKNLAPYTIKYYEENLNFFRSSNPQIKNVDALLADGINDIVILTCKTEESSALKDKAKSGKYRNKYLFTTCRKFKGLEADAVILIDVDDTTFNPKNVQLYYVGTSRARIRLDIVAMLSDDQCNRLLKDCLEIPRKSTKPKKDFM